MKRLKYLLIIFFIIIAYSFIQYKPDLSLLSLPFRRFPEKENAKTITLTCNYQGKDLSVSETVYGSVNDYYESEPRKRISYYTNRNKDFVFSYDEDSTVEELTDKIENLGAQNSLNSDQTLDLAACLLQSIPYDEGKAQKILSTDFEKYPYKEVVPRYPYETLYDFTGICTDKSYLGAAIFAEMGYETALLKFDAQRHLSIGIGVPAGFTALGTDYSIVELTGVGFVVGDIPNLKSTGFAENSINNLPEISGEDSAEDLNLIEIAAASGVEPVSTGKKYTRIVERTGLRNEIEITKKQLDSEKEIVLTQKEILEQNERELKEAESRYNSNPTLQTYNQYLAVYNSYQMAFSRANNEITKYNNLVRNYNLLVEKYKNY